MNNSNLTETSSNPSNSNRDRDDIETGTAPAVNQNATDISNIDDELGRRLNAQISQLSPHLKFIIPLILLVSLKFIIDNLINFILTFSTVMTFNRLQNGLNLQLSLKNKANLHTIFFMVLYNIFLFVTTVWFIHSMGYTENLLDRLYLRPASINELSMGKILWNCWITDLVVKMAAYFPKGFLCLWSFQGGLPYLKQWCRVERLKETFKSYIQLLRSIRPLQAHDSDHDIENQTSTQESHGPNEHNWRSQRVARRAAAVAAANSHSRNIVSSTSLRTDPATENAVSGEFILKLRICAVWDAAVYIYRCVLPIPLWTAYFSTGSLGQLLSAVYICFKLVDLSWKAKGVWDGIDQLVFSKLEFGHYVNSDETTFSECPVCFETPRKPVALECNHTFCEVCIVEWLEREKTCPVCRHEVKFGSSFLAMVKREASQATPVVI